jgi:GNAT superfamily N-acetyltransferase
MEEGYAMALTFAPVTSERWDDFAKLFGPRGACSGCWCMHFRLSPKEFSAGKGESNRQAMKAIVDSGAAPGLLAYVDGEPAGWCALAPREAYPRLERSRTLKPVDDQPVWSVTCFFVAKPYRRQGLSVALLNAAADYVRDQGGHILEGYPDVPGGALPDPFVFKGIASAFAKAGFTEVARPSATRAIMRRYL